MSAILGVVGLLSLLGFLLLLKVLLLEFLLLLQLWPSLNILLAGQLYIISFRRTKVLQVQRNTPLAPQDRSTKPFCSCCCCGACSKRTRQARAFRLEVVKRSKSVFGETDPRTLGYLELLAHDYYNRMTFTKAEQLQEPVVREKIQTYGQGHKETVQSIKFLAEVRSLGKLHRTIYW